MVCRLYGDSMIEPEPMDYGSLTDARVEGIRRTLETMELPELKRIGDELFPSAEHPWREVYFDFLNANAGAVFFHATTPDHVQVIYCPSKNMGLWYIPGGGMGPLQERGLARLREVVLGG